MRRKEWEARLFAAAFHGGLRKSGSVRNNANGGQWVQPDALMKEMGINVD